MNVKNEQDLRAIAAIINRNLIGLCNSKTVEESSKLFENVCNDLTELFKYKVSQNEKNCN